MRHSALRIAAGLLMTQIFSLAHAGVIENVSVQAFQDRSVITLDLSRRLVYKSHTPQSHGDLLVIQLQPLDALTADLPALARQSYPWKKSSKVPLSELVYDPNLNGFPVISLRFRTSVNFTVEGSPDGTRLSVTVLSKSHSAPTPVEKSEAMPGPNLSSKASRIVSVPVPPKNRPDGQSVLEVDQEMDQLMGQGKTAIIQADYFAAANRYTEALALPENQYSGKALEYLGLSRELNGENQAALEIYRTYVKRYPESKSTERLKQRLQSLETATAVPHKPLRKSETPAAADTEPSDSPFYADYYGSFSNFYNGFVLQTTQGAELVQSSVQADLFLTGMIKTEDWNIRANFSGGQLFNTIGSRGSASTTRITNGYVDVQQDKWGFNARLGRQVGYDGGVLGRFDGINAGYSLTDQVRLNAVVGFPVEYSSVTRENQDNIFYGFNTDLLNVEGPYESKMDFNLFFIQQFIEGIQDRLAVGGDIRFFTENINFYSLVDYDVLYNALNIATFNGNWRLPTQTNVNLTLDYRKAPILTTSNALLGNFLAANIDGLRSILTTDQIRDIAERNSVDSATFSLSLNHPISERFQVNGNFTATQLNQIPNTVVQSPNGQTLVDIEGIVATGWEYFTDTEIIGSNLFETGDFLALGFRYAKLQTSNRYGININSRIPFTPDFDISPRFRADYRRGQQNVNDWTLAPSLRLRYRVLKGLQLEAEFGAEFITDNIADDIGSFTDGNYYFLVGYRLDFPDFD